ncbi:hypothetical protein ANCCAN_17615 [Ancylostoma caninum]|uniref:Uncharacterized protein n=1 Tax=Ancylostoma caninum TaxID=29170 RepID=A0A368FWC9_ANCCA|nr:hypothetical protein ANCCAN_17615 [Ancylostoma caninum]
MLTIFTLWIRAVLITMLHNQGVMIAFTTAELWQYISIQILEMHR